MIAHHFGTDEIPRQCVTPGDYVLHEGRTYIASAGNDSNLLIVFYVQIMPDDFVMQLHRF